MNNIRKFRRELGWTQQKLAAMAGFSRVSITEMELNYGRGGKKNSPTPKRPKETTKQKIAAALGRTIEEVFPPDEAKRKERLAKGAARFVEL